MKIKSFMTMMAAAMAVVLVTSSCSKDDEEELEAPVATQVAGSYEGEESIVIMGDEEKETVTFEFTKASDTTLDMIIPQMGSEGPMVIPALTVKDILLTKSGSVVTGKLASYNGKVTNAKGEEKEYFVSNVVVSFNEKTVVASFSLKYGSMPFDFVTSFTGTKK